MSENIMSKKDKVFLIFTIISIILYVVAIVLSNKNGMYVREDVDWSSDYNSSFTLQGFLVIYFPLIYFFIAAIFTYNVPNIQNIMKIFISISWFVALFIGGYTYIIDPYLEVKGDAGCLVGSFIFMCIGLML